MPDTPDLSDDTTPWPLIAAYCTGPLSDTDRQTLDAWLAADTANAAEFDALVEAWRGIQPPARPDTDTRTLWADVASHTIQRDEGRRPPARPLAPRRQHIRTSSAWKRLAGISALGLATALLVWGGATMRSTAGRVASTDPVVHETGIGERTRFKMPDGTVVQLAPKSVLRYATDFSRNRVVELDGEAVFTVTHLSGAPFIVESHGTRTTVLGTTFSVRAYAQDSLVRVAVAEGRVQIGDGPVLALGDVSYTRPGVTPNVQHSMDVIKLLGWTQGRLAFERTPFVQVARDLERWYGIIITIPNTSLAARPVTAEFENLPTTAVLDVLAGILQSTYIRTGNHVTFTTSGDR